MECYIDLIENKAYTFEKGKKKETAVPSGSEGLVEEYINTISEAVAETDEN